MFFALLGTTRNLITAVTRVASRQNIILSTETANVLIIIIRLHLFSTIAARSLLFTIRSDVPIITPNLPSDLRAEYNAREI